MYGIYVQASEPATATVNLKNSLVTNNAAYGVYRSAGMVTVNVTYSDVWGNGTNYTNVTAGIGSFTANPLYVSSSNLRLTSNSPARFAGDAGQDLGPLPYVSDATPGLYGTLWSSRTLTAAGSPYAVAGDLTVSTGVTLTIEPGVTVAFASTDIIGAGSSTGKPK